MKPCVMCKVEADCDYLGRCDSCFRIYMAMSDDEKQELKKTLGIPFVPIFHGGR